MGYLSRLDLFSDSQVVITSGPATNVKSTEGLQFGAGNQLWVTFSTIIAADFISGDETYQFDLYTSAAANMSSPLSLLKRIIPATTLIAGYQFSMGIPQEGLLGYLCPYYTVGGTTPSITITSWLTDEPPPDHTRYQFGVTAPV